MMTVLGACFSPPLLKPHTGAVYFSALNSGQKNVVAVLVYLTLDESGMVVFKYAPGQGTKVLGLPIRTKSSDG